MASTSEAPAVIEVFYSYSHKDEELRDQLETHLSTVKRLGLIKSWHDRKIGPGEEWAREIDTRLKTAHIILLLISADFLASDYCYLNEMQQALERHEEGTARVIPIILREVDLQGTPFSKLQALPKNAKPVTSWSNRDEAFADIAIGIRIAIEELYSTLLAGTASPPNTRFVRSQEMLTLPSFWNVPHELNPFFTGREDVLQALHEALRRNNATALTQVQAISGLGGIGKTQTAVQYAYHYRHEYNAVFWIRADSEAALHSGFVEIAKLLNLPEQDAQNSDEAVQAVRRWLVHKNDWLLIFDNADKPELLTAFRPHNAKGHILLTSRAQVFDSLGISKPIELEVMLPEEGCMFLLHRTGRDDKDLKEQNAVRELAYELGYLPLALEQAAAYITEKKARFQDYLASYRIHHLEVLNKSLPKTGDYPESVTATWTINFRELEQLPVAADLLRLSAFLNPDSIPLELIASGASQLGPMLSEALATADEDPLALNEALEPLTRYSLIHRDVDMHSYSIHRLVQQAVKDAMDVDTQHIWTERAVRAVNLAFPYVTPATWNRCQQYLQHAQACAAFIRQWEMTFMEGVDLLSKTGEYLRQRSQYKESEPFLTHALEIQEKTLGPEHPDVASSLHDLAWLYHDEGKFAQAEPLLIRELAIREKAFGLEHPDVATSLNTLAEIYMHLEKYDEAQPLLMRAKAILEQSGVSGSVSMSNILHNLARFYSGQGKYEQAESLFQRAIAIYEKTLEPDHYLVFYCRLSMAQYYQDQGKFSQAKAIFQELLEIQEKAEGPEGPLVAKSLAALAWLYHDQGHYEQAEPLLTRALAIQNKTLRPNHSDRVKVLYCLADIYMHRAKYILAEPLLIRNITIVEEKFGTEHSNMMSTLNKLAELYQHQGRYNKAEPLYRRILTFYKRTLGSEHAETVKASKQYAAVLQKKRLKSKRKR